jgi:hypothetical protein
MLYGEDKPDEFGMTSGQRIQEFTVVSIVFIMLLAFFLKVLFF